MPFISPCNVQFHCAKPPIRVDQAADAPTTRGPLLRRGGSGLSYHKRVRRTMTGWLGLWG